ncbi:hypothetical protein IGI04_025257 [Brassica rapa subsp. trilocularis]|uniref:SGS domain-containing protein n=1 Tax=Brassica rapa subsp. trilocularis TaxID=1813537 RepID=A0ABQ7MCK6_BRACM|nr:hypothetical protein IGI04_025257 [Brassica rapa subsp. trilocularis]
MVGKKFTREEEEDLRVLVNALLSAADLDEESEPLSSYVLSKWHSVESPLDPYIFERHLRELGRTSKTWNQREEACVQPCQHAAFGANTELSRTSLSQDSLWQDINWGLM